MIRKLMALAGLVVALEACAGPPPPTYSADAFKGIFNQNSASVPANAPATMTPPVGIIFSENVETYLGYIKNAGEYWDSVVPTSLKNTCGLCRCRSDLLRGPSAGDAEGPLPLGHGHP